MNREAIADSYNLNRITEVACEFNVRRWGPSYVYTKAAPAACRIFDHQCKTTFATQSALSGQLNRAGFCRLLAEQRTFGKPSLV